MAALVALLFDLRARALSSLGTPKARADWDKWRADAAEHDGIKGPVKRRVPKSTEPPTLVLLRDHFGVVVAAGLTFSTVFFAFFALLARGLWKRRP